MMREMEKGIKSHNPTTTTPGRKGIYGKKEKPPSQNQS
jgi:hypothetical protein